MRSNFMSNERAINDIARACIEWNRRSQGRSQLRRIIADLRQRRRAPPVQSGYAERQAAIIRGT